jgi:hypothetical protein
LRPPFAPSWDVSRTTQDALIGRGRSHSPRALSFAAGRRLSFRCRAPSLGYRTATSRASRCSLWDWTPARPLTANKPRRQLWPGPTRAHQVHQSLGPGRPAQARTRSLAGAHRVLGVIQPARAGSRRRPGAGARATRAGPAHTGDAALPSLGCRPPGPTASNGSTREEAGMRPAGRPRKGKRGGGGGGGGRARV